MNKDLSELETDDPELQFIIGKSFFGRSRWVFS